MPASHPSVRLVNVDVVGGEIEPEVAHERADFFLFQPQISVSDLRQLTSGSPALDRKNGIDAGSDCDVHPRRKPVDKRGQPCKGRGRDDVQIVEDQPCRTGPQRQLIDQRCHDVFDVVRTFEEKVEGIGDGTGLDGGERGRDGRPHPELVAIPPVAREPGAPSLWPLSRPGRQQHAFPDAGAACHQRAGVLEGQIQPAKEVRPCDQGVGKGGRTNFVTAGPAPIIAKRVTRRSPNHPAGGDDVRGGLNHTVRASMEPTTYVITFRGEAGRAVSAAFADLDVSTNEGLTILQATVPDQAALHGVIERIRALGLELVAVRKASNDEE